MALGQEDAGAAGPGQRAGEDRRPCRDRRRPQRPRPGAGGPPGARRSCRACRPALAADPADLQARYDLATALNATGEREQAADALLDIIKRNRAWNEDAARLQLLKFFEAWGFDDPATMAARRKLSALLFS